MDTGEPKPDVVRESDAAIVLSEELRRKLGEVARGATVKAPVFYKKNPKGSIMNEAGALGYALTDLDSWYSIIMSSIIGYTLNRYAAWQRPATTTFFRELVTFTLYELLQPRLSGVLPRFLLENGDIDTHRYRAGPIRDSNRRLKYAARETEVAKNWDWTTTFQEWANAAPVILVSMIIVDVGLGKRSDVASLLHYMFVMLLVSVTRFAKNGMLVNNPARQSAAEIFRRAMALGLSFEVVPKLTFKGKVPPQTYKYDPAEMARRLRAS